jgi:peroxiredoxin
LTALTLKQELEICTEKCKHMDAPLRDRLSAFADDVQRLSPEFAAIVDRMLKRLYDSGAGLGAPDVGDEMPPFVLTDENGKLVSLDQLLEKGQVVISFNRGHWCPYCILNADALANVEQEIHKEGAQLVLITPETQKFTRIHKRESGGTFPILTDLDSGYALELELAIKIGDEKRAAMTAAGWDIALYQDNDNWTLPIPATFVVGEDGRVMARFVDPDYRKRMDIDDLLFALRDGRRSGQPMPAQVVVS